MGCQPFRGNNDRVDRASRVYARALRRYVRDLETRVGEELTSELDEIVTLGPDGQVTEATRQRVLSALRRAKRGNEADAEPRALEEARRHTGRMSRVSLDVWTEQIEGLTDDPERAQEMRRIALEADTGPTADETGMLQGELVVSIRDKAIDQLADKVIAALETLGDKSAKIDRAIAQIDTVFEMTRDRADRIAAWESESMNTLFARVYNLANNLQTYRWIDRDDNLVRPLHRARDGEIFDWDDPPDEEPYDGHPGVPPNCRCRAEPVIPD